MKLKKHWMRDCREVLWKQKLDIAPQDTRCGFQIYFPRKKNYFYFNQKVLFSLKRSGKRVTYLPFKEHYGVIMLLASVIEIVNFYKHADYHNKGHI